MNKQAVAAFLAGVAGPLLAASLFHRTPAPMNEDVERGQLTEVRQSVDEQAVLKVLNGAGNVQQLTLEEYLVGVVLAEMPASFDREALKAQAVVARTYTRKRMGSSKHDTAAVCMDPACCQAHRTAQDYLDQGGRERDVEKVRQAVRDTDGLVLEYEGRLIDATYFSCSGGTTEDAVAVWGQDVPYLQAVDSPGEEEAPRFSDSVTFTAAELSRRLGISDRGNPADWFGPVTHTEGGGVETLTIGGETFSGTKLRRLLGLRSTAFSWEVHGDSITITTRGFGHRVGMSQYGAQAMAEEGSGFGDILAHYYQGTSLVQMEE